jgi:hypothetical protein
MHTVMWADSRVFFSVLSHRPEQNDGGFFVAASYEFVGVLLLSGSVKL